MPTEIARTSSRKRLFLPNGGFVWVPVIETITFKDVVSRGQESTWTFDNTPASTRTGHAHDVYPSVSNGGAVDTVTVMTPLSVERTDSVFVKDFPSRGQETLLSPLNNDPPPAEPDNLGTDPHKTVHYVRYCMANVPNSPAWVDVELIDEMFVKDIVSRGQETDFTLTANLPGSDAPADAVANQANDPYEPLFAECDMSLPISDYAFTTIDPPYRLDPFQNIVNIPGPHRYRGFYKTYATVSKSGPSGYNGFYSIKGILGNLVGWTMADGNDAGAAMNDIVAHVVARPSITLVEVSGILAGPNGTSGTFAWDYICWKWEGDGYDSSGNQTLAIPISGYVTDPDIHKYGTAGFGGVVYSLVDPGVPPV